MSQNIPTLFNEPYAYMEIANEDGFVWSNVKEYDVVMYASHCNMSYHLGASPNATSRLSMTPTECMFFNDFFIQNQMVLRGIQLQESSPFGDNSPYQVTQQVSDIKGFEPWGQYIKVTLSNGQSGLQVLDSQKVPQITLSTTTGRIHPNSNDTAIEPSYSWSNNSNLGMYHYENHVIGFTSLGLDTARIHSHGRIVLSNQSMFRPGCNYLSLIPQIASTCNVELRFASESNNTRPTITFYDENRNVLHMGKSMSNAFIYTCNNNLDVGTNFQSHLFIDPFGQIGLKTIFPTTHFVINNGALPLSNAQLQVQNTACNNTSNALYAAIKAGSSGAATCNYFAFGYRSNIPGLVVNNGNDPLVVYTSNVERARWDSNTGFFGLFSNNPKYELDLRGNARMSSNLFLSQIPSGSLSINSETPRGAHIHVEVPPARIYTNPIDNAGLFVNNESTNGTRHSIITLQANVGDPFLSFSSRNNADSEGWAMGIDTSDAKKFKLSSDWTNLNNNTAMTVNSDGYVGFGTNLLNTHITIFNGGSYNRGIDAEGILQLQNLVGTDGGFIGCVNNDGPRSWVGIGYSGSYAGTVFPEIRLSNRDDVLAIKYINGQKFCFKSDGKMAINTPLTPEGKMTLPQYELDVTGTIRSTTDVITNSDVRLKEDLRPIKDSIEKVNQLTGYTYLRKDDPSSGKRYAGLVAQDLQKVLPEAVNEDSSGFLSIAYGNISALLVEAIKDLNTRMAAIEKKLENI